MEKTAVRLLHIRAACPVCSSIVFAAARCIFWSRLCSTRSSHESKKRNAYRILGLSFFASKEEIKQRFIDLAKLYHPDAANDHGENAKKFAEIREAYEFVMQDIDKHVKERAETFENVEERIEHTAPQHRQYLEYGGFGAGNPFQRQKQYQQHRAVSVSENIYDYLLDKKMKSGEAANASQNSVMSVTQEQAYFSKKQKTTNAVERIVEDLILQAMKKGDFNNLRGMGKPLKAEMVNPYVDDMEYKINKVLINNGFAPPWIMKEADIRSEVANFREKLRFEYARHLVSQSEDFKNFVPKGKSKSRWLAAQEKVDKQILKLNETIREYNLVAPTLSRQIFPYSFKSELENAIRDVQTSQQGNDNQWIKKARKNLNHLKEAHEADHEGLFSQFVKGLLSLKNM